MSSSTATAPECNTQIYKSKIVYLDGLRGFAALIVVLHHFKNLVLPGAPSQTHFPYEEILHSSPVALIFCGRLAVLIFFVHSGLVLSWKYLATKDHRILLSMSLRRGFRLGIPIAVSIGFAFTLMRLGLMHSEEVVKISGTPFWQGMYQFTPTLLTALKEACGGALLYDSRKYNDVLWTMPIELVCSYGVFLILPLIRRLPIEQVLLVFAIASISLLHYYPWMVCFLIGIVLAQLYQEGRFSKGGRLYKIFSDLPFLWRVTFAVASIFALYPNWSGAHLPVPEFLNPKDLVQIISATLFVLLVLLSPLAQRFLSNQLSQFLGKVSFSAYLVHWPILASFSSWVILALTKKGVGYGSAILVTLVATILIVYLAAWIMTVCIDQWAIRFGKTWLEKYLFNPENNSPLSRQKNNFVIEFSNEP